MMELLKNAWPGWLGYTTGGKVVALLLLVLLLYWFARSEWKSYFSSLGIYTTIMAVCCICPLTAALLMAYQTRFYDYQWIWNLVPVTIVVALGGTLVWSELMEKCSKQKGCKWKGFAVTCALAGIICISGGMGTTSWEPDEEAAKRQETVQVLEALHTYMEADSADGTAGANESDGVDGAAVAGESDGTVKLWAPQPIMAYARAVDGKLRLPYGRNMWDITLNAYSYDVYGTQEKDLYAWMCNAEVYGTGEVECVTESGKRYVVTATDCMDTAKKLGVTHVLLPGNMLPEVVAELEDYLDTKAEILNGYYLFCL